VHVDAILSGRKELIQLAIVYCCDVLELLKDKGFTSYRLRKEKLISQGALQKIREGKLLSWHELDQVCAMLQCQPGDLVRHVAEE
jgi:putative transcriptional regulator